jgi:hypothetical protein
LISRPFSGTQRHQRCADSPKGSNKYNARTSVYNGYPYDSPLEPTRFDNCLGGHLKTGHRWTPQNRPTERNQNKSIYILLEVCQANTFLKSDPAGFVLTSPERRIRQRRDATRATTQRPEWRGGLRSPFGKPLGFIALRQNVGDVRPQLRQRTSPIAAGSSLLTANCFWLDMGFSRLRAFPSVLLQHNAITFWRNRAGWESGLSEPAKYADGQQPLASTARRFGAPTPRATLQLMAVMDL